MSYIMFIYRNLLKCDIVPRSNPKIEDNLYLTRGKNYCPDILGVLVIVKLARYLLVVEVDLEMPSRPSHRRHQCESMVGVVS